jgi:hypothetical protein
MTNELIDPETGEILNYAQPENNDYSQDVFECQYCYACHHAEQLEVCPTCGHDELTIESPLDADDYFEACVFMSFSPISTLIH